MDNKKINYNKIPNVIGKYESDARDFLHKKKIKVKKYAKKKFNLAYKSGTVIAIKPDVDTKISENETAILYVAENRIFTIILSLAVIILCLIGMKTYEITYVMLGVNGPVIEESTKYFSSSNTVTVTIPSELNNLTTYQYCLSTVKSADKCMWIDCNDSITINDSGIWYVYMRAYNEYKDKYSNPSNPVEVKIDNNEPIIENITFTKKDNKTIFEVLAIDEISGIMSYSYSIDGINYVKSSNRFKIDSSYDKVYVKIVDKVGNETIKEISI